MLMSKAEFAFQETAKIMFERGPVYFWTFTFADVKDDWKYGYHWDRFNTHLRNFYWGNVGGVRVVEPHEEHGLHFHVLVNRRMNIHWIKRIAGRAGMGHVWVKKCDRGTIPYMAMYLKKTWNEDNPLHDGVRRWSPFGNIRSVKMRNVQMCSPFMDKFRELKMRLNRTFTFGEYKTLCAMYERGEDIMDLTGQGEPAPF
jgi:hypothetical protein